jgi:Zn-dependent protease/predicted transcriptional regulator
MKGSLRLGKIAGIELSIHWTFSLLLLFIIYNNYRAGHDLVQIVWSLVFILCIFVTIFLHELGHSLTAKKFGINTKDITLLPIGGLARLERIPEKPNEELAVAIAGPLVNLSIAFVTYFFVDFSDIEHAEENLIQGINAGNFLFHFFVVNIWLSVFNLIPAFPMDGGRVLRAVLSHYIGRLKATNIAARIGQVLALGFIVLGFYINPFLILIGLFIMFGAQGELSMVTTSSLLKGNKIKDIVMTRFETLESTDTLVTAVGKLLNGTSKSFLILEDKKPIGTLNRDQMIKALTDTGKETLVANVMSKTILSFNADSLIEDVYKSMGEQKQELTMVLENDIFIGVIDTENIMEFIMIRSAVVK